MKTLTLQEAFDAAHEELKLKKEKEKKEEVINKEKISTDIYKDNKEVKQ